jgi:hypothetical protein
MTTEFTVASLNYFPLLYRKGQPIHHVKGKLKEIAGELNDNQELNRNSERIPLCLHRG